ncbi:MAG TPA: hypothetical protein VNT03_18930 [Baekduia sp.]|nr:hypothetical protein [Baekduia sp.]
MPPALRSPRAPLAVLGVLLVIGAAVIWQAGHDLTFFFDEWDFVTGRRGVSTDSLLGDHNGHLSLLPVLAYKLLLQVFGLGHYWPYRLLLLILHLSAVVLLFMLARRRAGGGAALCAAALLLFLGAAWEDLVWAFQIGFVGATAAGLAMMLALDRDDRAGDVLAALLMAVGLASASIGIPFALVAIVDLALRGQWRRLARVTAVPVGVYLAWRLGWGHSEATMDNLDDAPSYAFQMLQAAVGGASGLGITAVGPTLGVVVLAGFAVAIARGAVWPRLLAVLAGVLSLWLLTALARGQLGEPQASRYIYPSVTLLLLAGLELWPRTAVVSGRVLVVVGALVAVACLGNLQTLSTGATGIRAATSVVRAEQTALELARAKAPFDFQPDPSRAPQLIAGRYLSAVDAFGSPALTQAELLKAPEDQREAADDVLRRLELSPAHAVAAPRSDDGACQTVPSGGEVALPSGQVTFAAAKADVVQVRIKRYATAYPADPTLQVGGGASELAIAPDRGTQQWRAQVAGGPPARICPG